MTAPSVVGTPVVGRPIGADVGVWSALPSSYTYQWSSCNGGSCANISGATNESYTPTTSDTGLTLEVTVTATNTSGTSSAVTSAASSTVVSPPSSVTAPTITGSATIGQTLTATDGTWSPNPTTYAYQWLRCSGGTCTNETNATSGTYVVSSSDVGSRIEVKVTASDAVGAATATSQPTAAVPVIPTTVSLTSSETTAKSGDTVALTATVSPAVNGGTFTFSQNGTPIAGCSALPMSSSTIGCIGTALGTGTVTITGAYSGDTASGASSSSLSLVITATGTTTTTQTTQSTQAAQLTQTTSSTGSPPPVVPPSRTITRPGRSKRLPDFSLRVAAVRLASTVSIRYYWAVQNVSCYNRASAVDVTVAGHTIAAPCRRNLMLASAAVADHINYAITFQAIEYGRRHKVVARGVVYRASMYMPGPEAQWTAIQGPVPVA